MYTRAIVPRSYKWKPWGTETCPHNCYHTFNVLIKAQIPNAPANRRLTPLVVFLQGL